MLLVPRSTGLHNGGLNWRDGQGGVGKAWFQGFPKRRSSTLWRPCFGWIHRQTPSSCSLMGVEFFYPEMSWPVCCTRVDKKDTWKVSLVDLRSMFLKWEEKKKHALIFPIMMYKYYWFDFADLKFNFFFPLPSQPSLPTGLTPLTSPKSVFSLLLSPINKLI